MISQVAFVDQDRRACGVRPFQRSAERVISFEEALSFLRVLETSKTSSKRLHDELPAIITHWLSDINNTPLFLGKETHESWLKALSLLLQSRSAALGRPLTSDVRNAPKISKPEIPFPGPSSPSFSFIDLFAGIGGFRIALQDLGGKSVFSSEWDPYAKDSYFCNFGEVPFGDIKAYSGKQNPLGSKGPGIPRHDILAGGFPCQAFSQAGLQLGFNDARGTLFFEILKIAEKHRPKVVFLENVKRLKTHDEGKTFKCICNSLREIGYTVSSEVLSAYDFGVPQNRERIFIVASLRNKPFKFPKPTRRNGEVRLGDILEESVDSQFTISDKMLAGHLRRLEEHKKKGNGFGFSVFSEDSKYANTISARYWKDGSEILIKQEGMNPRMLTPRECARLQGFPDSFKITQHKRHSYQQFGNSVAVPVVRAVAQEILNQYFN